MTTKFLVSDLSPFGARLRIAAALKKVPATFEPAPGGSGSAEVKAINPFGQVPIALVGGRPLVESQALLDYLEDLHPDAPRLRPADPAQAARVRMIAMLFDNHAIKALGPMFVQLRSSPPDVKIIHGALDDMTAALEKLATFLDADGPAVGGTMTNADCAMAPFAWLIGTLAPKFGVPSPFDRVPRLAAWWKHVSAVPEVATVTDGMMKALAAFMGAKK
ncbi:MAG TPA: glutathione S-transferase family protein [Nevskiaceae bacterium]|nr:glutathione S-transferase family protein [Nevskiaceae bacterium]